MRKLRLVCGLIVVLFSSTVAAEQALLWQVQSPRGAISFLFGTIHSDDPRVLDLPKPVALAFDKAKTVVLEMDLGQVSPEAMSQALMLPHGRSLADLVPASLYRETVKVMSTLGYPEAVTRQLSPWAIQLTLSMPPQSTGMFLDAVLYEQAVAANKRVVGLETMEEQLSVFRDLSQSDQVVLLQQAVKDYPQLGKLMESITQAWLARDLDKIATMSSENMSELPASLQQRFGRSLIESRNHRMAERSLPVLRQGGAFIAVGTLHLVGDEGLVALLRQEGMKVTAVY
jgi:uncharacterized protein